jgi:hypothetical protein
MGGIAAIRLAKISKVWNRDWLTSLAWWLAVLGLAYVAWVIK